ncbi:hypothetical protein [Chryseobacterium sp. MMS23-Vi53]|uniref:hypothetical protein n=1 Tax=Chryseobacterium sp. MMS23-Vi53 TaxID=3386644 RepID=UPI0039E86EAB
MKTKTFLRRTIFFVLIFLCIHCNNKDSAPTEGASSGQDTLTLPDSIEAASDSTAATSSGKDTINLNKPDSSKVITKKDSVAAKPVFQTKEIKANTLIYAPKDMSKDNSYNVLAMVNMNDIEKSIASMQKEATESNNKKIKSSDIKVSKNVTVTNKIKVTMKYDKDIFDVLNSDDDEIKILDKNQKEIVWKWLLKPKKYSSNTHLTFVFQSMDNNEILFEEEKFVNVNISVTNTFWGYLEYLAENPKYTIPSIILPLITFFAGRFLRKKKESQDKE